MLKFSFCILTLSLLLSAPAKADILEGYKSLQVLETSQAYETELKAWEKLFNSNSNTFSDINYSNTNSNDFEPISSLLRASYFSLAFNTKDHAFYKSQKAKAISLGAARYWLKNDFTSYNWWFNQIGVQIRLLPIVLNFFDDFNPQEKAKIHTILKRVTFSNNGKPFTAQNLLWSADLTMIRGLLFSNAKDVREGSRAIKSLLVYTPYKDGFQTDSSFFQHGTLIYQAGYGASFTEIIGKYYFLFSGSEYAFSKEEWKIVDDHILIGQRLITFGNWIDFGASGREFSRVTYGPDKIRRGLEYILMGEPYLRESYQSYLDSIKKNSPEKLAVNHHFYAGDMMVHRGTEFYSSARFHSEKTLNTDFPSNNEGLLSHNISDGALIFTKDTKEYDKVFAFWNYNRIPGTTADQKAIIPTTYIPGVESGRNMVTKGLSTFAGGVSDGNQGLASIDFKKALVSYDLSVKKTWFFTEFGVIALGSDIKCANCPGEVVTTIDQTKFNMENYLPGESQISINDKEIVNLSDHAWDVEIENVIGNWYKVNKQMPNQDLSASIFSLSINHGKRPTKASYAYAIIQSAEAKKELDLFSFINTSSSHCAWSNHNTYACSLFNTEEVKMGDLTLKASSPLLVMITVLEKGLKVHVSDPLKNTSRVNLQISYKDETLQKLIALPAHPKAGATIETHFDI